MASNIARGDVPETQAQHEAMDATVKPPGGRTALRRHLLALRAGIPPAERAAKDEAIGHALRQWLDDMAVVTKHRGVVALWWPLPGEPDLRPLFVQLHEAGWVVALPSVTARGEPLVFGRWQPGCEMRAGLHGVSEPSPFEPLEPDVLVAPCVGFDLRGWRLGYGGGYYDRTLAAMPAPLPSAGVGYDCCERRLDPQPHDRRFDAMITETRTVLCAP